MTTQAQPLTTADRVRGMMKRHNLSQNQMARFLGISQGNIGNWLTGTRKPNKVVTRLVGILEQVEVFYPTLFQVLLGQATKP